MAETLAEYQARTSNRSVFKRLAEIDSNNLRKEVNRKVFEVVEAKQADAIIASSAERGKHLRTLANLDEWFDTLDDEVKAKKILIQLNGKDTAPYPTAKTDSLYGGLLQAMKSYSDGKMTKEWRLLKNEGNLFITKL
jgi:hypothetical protein